MLKLRRIGIEKGYSYFDGWKHDKIRKIYKVKKVSNPIEKQVVRIRFLCNDEISIKFKSKHTQENFQIKKQTKKKLVCWLNLEKWFNWIQVDEKIWFRFTRATNDLERLKNWQIFRVLYRMEQKVVPKIIKMFKSSNYESGIINEVKKSKSARLGCESIRRLLYLLW